MGKKKAGLVIAFLVALIGAGWAMGFFAVEDPDVTEAKRMADELATKMDTLSPEERQAEFGALREKTRDLPEEKRRAVYGGMGQFFMQRLDKLLVMPPAERNAELDKWIDRMETMRKSMKAGGDQGGWRNRFADMSEAERDQRRKQRLDRSSPDMRAKFDRLWDLLNDRRTERGMEPFDMFGGH